MRLPGISISRLRGLAVAALALAVLCTAATADEKVTLEQRYAPGEYVMTVTTTWDQTAEVNDVPQPAQRMSKTIVADLTVGKPDESGAREIVMAFSRIAEEQRIGLETATYDSEGPAELQSPALARIYDPMLHTEVKIVLDAEGKAKRVEGLDRLWETIAEQNQQIAPLARQMKTIMGDETIAAIFGEGVRLLPNKPVKVGDKWHAELDVEVPPLGKVPYRADMKLTLLKGSGEDRLAVFEITGKATINQPTEAQMLGIKMDVTAMDLKQKGNIHYSVGKGYPAASSLEQTADIEATVNRPSDQAVPMKIRQKVVAATTVVPKEPATQPETQP